MNKFNFRCYARHRFPILSNQIFIANAEFSGS